MAHTKFPVEVLTPEGEVFNDEVEMVSTQTAVGSIGVLANHAPLLAMLDPTELRLYRSESRDRPLRPGRGLHAGGASNRALLLVEEAHDAGRRSTPQSCASACSRPSTSSSRPATTPRARAGRGARQAPLGGVSEDRRGQLSAGGASSVPASGTALKVLARWLTS